MDSDGRSTLQVMCCATQLSGASDLTSVESNLETSSASRITSTLINLIVSGSEQSLKGRTEVDVDRYMRKQLAKVPGLT